MPHRRNPSPPASTTASPPHAQRRERVRALPPRAPPSGTPPPVMPPRAMFPWWMSPLDLDPCRAGGSDSWEEPSAVVIHGVVAARVDGARYRLGGLVAG